MYRFSIIIPVLGDRRLFDDTLASVLRYRSQSCEVIVVHDGTYEDPYGLDGEVKFISNQRRANLIRFFNFGIDQSSGELIALIRPGIELDEGWHSEIEESFEDQNIGSVAPIIVTTSEPDTIVAAGVTKRFGFNRDVEGASQKIARRTLDRIAPLGPTSWAAFYRRSALEMIETIGEELDACYLDLDLALSLKTLGFETRVCDHCVVSIERPKLIEKELASPHGQSAQRAYTRHEAQTGTTSSIFQSACAFAKEVVTSPFRPVLFQHAILRLGALGKINTDQHFAQQLALEAKLKRHKETLGVEDSSTRQARDAA